MEERLRYVKVTNKSDAPFVDMFDGVPVTIDPGGSQNIRPEQAWHFFGYVEGATQQQMVLHTAKRRGWNTKEHLEKDERGKTLMQRLFEQLLIEPITYRLVEEAPAADAPIPAEVTEEDAEVEHSAPPPKFVPAKPAARKAAPKRARDDSDE